MKRISDFFRAAAVIAAASLLMGCSRAEPGEPITVDLAPQTQEDCVTPPFWVVEDSSTGAQIFMLGSMHAGNSDTKYPDYVLDAFSNSTWVGPELDTAAFSQNASLQRKCAAYLRLEDTTMEQLLGDSYADTLGFFTEKGIYQQNMEYLCPFFWASAASGLVTDSAGLDPAYGTESLLLELAHSQRKEVREIEGGEAQYKMMGSIPMSIQLSTLAECVGDDNIAAQAEDTRQLYAAWSSFDDEFFRELSVYDPETVDNPSDWEEYYDMMYTSRQKLMAEFITDSLKNGELGFVFVGTMHYYAEPSIITLLEDAGYTVNAVRPEKSDDKAA